MLAKTDPKGAVDVYCKFHISDPPTFDDGYILGEIVRLLMKAEDYEDKRLVKNMILYGKVYGLGMTRLVDLFMRTSFVKNIVNSLDLYMDSICPPHQRTYFLSNNFSFLYCCLLNSQICE